MKLGEIEYYVESGIDWAFSSFQLLENGLWRELTIGQSLFVLFIVFVYLNLFIKVFHWLFSLRISMELVSAILVVKSLVIMIVMNLM
jgi:hypothetical protein